MREERLSKERLAEIRERAEAATLGAWRDDRRADGVPAVHNGKVRICDTFRADGQSVLNAEFIAHAREDVPALLDEVERLTAENEELELDKNVMIVGGYNDTMRIQTKRTYKALRTENSRLRAELEAITKQINRVRSCKMCANHKSDVLENPCAVCNMIVKQNFEWARPCAANTPAQGATDETTGGGRDERLSKPHER